jgi:hypothetical protein
MLGKIDRNFYCSGDSVHICGHFPKCSETCRQRHRKWPTPEQFKEEYGLEWQGAVYYHCSSTESQCDDECEAKGWMQEEYGCLCEPIIVCACTPWGRPPNDWRPE